jgi:hypothetical protein
MSIPVDLAAGSPPAGDRGLWSAVYRKLVRTPMLKMVNVFRLAAEFAYGLLTGPF